MAKYRIAWLPGDGIGRDVAYLPEVGVVSKADIPPITPPTAIPIKIDLILAITIHLHS